MGLVGKADAGSMVPGVKDITLDPHREYTLDLMSFLATCFSFVASTRCIAKYRLICRIFLCLCKPLVFRIGKIGTNVRPFIFWQNDRTEDPFHSKDLQITSNKTLELKMLVIGCSF